MTKSTREATMTLIALQAVVMVEAREKAERILGYASRQFIGQKYEPFRSGNLAGVYQITSVDISAYNGAIIAHGRKITPRGLGRQCWDLGRVQLSRFRK